MSNARPATRHTIEERPFSLSALYTLSKMQNDQNIRDRIIFRHVVLSCAASNKQKRHQPLSQGEGEAGGSGHSGQAAPPAATGNWPHKRQVAVAARRHRGGQGVGGAAARRGRGGPVHQERGRAHAHAHMPHSLMCLRLRRALIQYAQPAHIVVHVRLRLYICGSTHDESRANSKLVTHRRRRKGPDKSSRGARHTAHTRTAAPQTGARTHTHTEGVLLRRHNVCREPILPRPDKPIQFKSTS
jgi:hypothetical protein